MEMYKEYTRLRNEKKKYLKKIETLNIHSKKKNEYILYINKLYNKLYIRLKNTYEESIKIYEESQIHVDVDVPLNNIDENNNDINTNTNTNKKALLIGINYTNTRNALRGCINDVTLIENLLISEYNYKNENIVMLTDNTVIKPTKKNIIDNITSLLSNAKKGDVLFLMYSGHGINMNDYNNDEIDGKDEGIYTIDRKGIWDDELKQIIDTNLKKDVTLIALFDNCYSGTILDLKYQYLNNSLDNKYVNTNNSMETNSQVIVISGSRDNQISSDAYIKGTFNGALTKLFVNVLKKSKQQNSKLSWEDLIVNIRENLQKYKFTQIAQLSSGNILNITDKMYL